jgi:hypothetical protein
MYAALFYILWCLTVIEGSVELTAAGSRVIENVKKVFESVEPGGCRPVVTIAYAQTIDGSMYVKC